MIEQIIALLRKPIKDVAKDPTVTSFNVRAKMSKMGGDYGFGIARGRPGLHYWP